MSLVKSFLQEGILIEPSLLEFFKRNDIPPEIVSLVKGMNISFLSKESLKLHSPQLISSLESLQLHRNGPEKQFIQETIAFLSCFSTEPKPEKCSEIKLTNYKVLESWNLPSRKVSVEDFVKHFRNRFVILKGILQSHSELVNLTTINKLAVQKQQSVSVIGLVCNKRTTKNKNVILELEDLTGKISVLVNQNNEEAFKKVQQIVLDEVIGVKCSGSSEILFVNEIVFPEAFSKKAANSDYPEDYAAFISDTHVGSTMFLEEEFSKFISWINMEKGSDAQKEIAGKIKYLFITGDTVDGVGVYPGQEDLLKIKDIRAQYAKLAEYLNMIRKDITIFMIPGQHDAVRVAEPQPPVGENYAPELYKLDNLILLSNPSLVEVCGKKVLLYHGASYHNLIDGIEELRLSNAHNTPTRVSKLLLSKRHLAPTHSDVVYVPTEDTDPLAMRESPDIFATGDLHKTDVSMYNNIRIIAGSCWQSMTPFEEKVGNHPDPCKVPILNLKTNAIKIIDFSGN